MLTFTSPGTSKQLFTPQGMCDVILTSQLNVTTEHKCDHQDYVRSFKEKIDKSYCKNGMDLYGVKCSKYKYTLFPTILHLILACVRINHYKCKYSLCGPCYHQYVNNEGVTCNTRRSRRNIK